MQTLTNLNTNEIKKFLSNRHPFLMIDFVKKIEIGVCAEGYKNLTANEWFFPVHFPEEPMMPGMIQTEALLQMLSLTVLTMNGNAQKLIRVTSAKKIQFKKRIVPGNKLDIVATLNSWQDNVANGESKGFIDGVEVCSGAFVFSIIDK